MTDAITAMNTNSLNWVLLGNNPSKLFTIRVGVPQGNTIVPFPFHIYITVYIKLNWEPKNTKIIHINYHRAFESIQVLEDSKQLGARIASSLSDFCQQKGIAWSNFSKLQTILRSTSLPLHLKLGLFDTMETCSWESWPTSSRLGRER